MVRGTMINYLGPYLKLGKTVKTAFGYWRIGSPGLRLLRVGSIQKQILFTLCSEDKARVKAVWAVHRYRAES